jgi:hypothetical protein
MLGAQRKAVRLSPNGFVHEAENTQRGDGFPP